MGCSGILNVLKTGLLYIGSTDPQLQNGLFVQFFCFPVPTAYVLNLLYNLQVAQKGQEIEWYYTYCSYNLMHFILYI